MNLADMLSYADIHDLGRIAKNYACECNGHSKNELIQSILIAVNHKEVFDKQIKALSWEEIRLINYLIFNPRDKFGLEDLLAIAKQAKFTLVEGESWNPRDIISKFKQRGWLFNGHSQQTKYLFHLPLDLKQKFMVALHGKFKNNISFLSEYPAVYRDEQTLLVDDILIFLKIVGQQDLQISAEGYMYKRYLQQILEAFNISEEAVAKAAWRFGYGRRYKEYPSRFSFVYDYCYFHDLIIEDNTQLRLTELGQQKVVAGMKEDMLQVYRFWLKLYKSAVPNIVSLVHWTERLTQSWVTAASLSEVICPLIKPYYYDSAASIFENRLLQMMMHLGLLRLGEDINQGKVIQVSKLGSSLIQGIYVNEAEFLDLSLTKA
jgi:hypothetical protein